MAKAKKSARKPAKKAAAKKAVKKVAKKAAKAAPKKAAKKPAKAAPKKVAPKARATAKATNGAPKMSTKPFGQDGKALQGVRVLDFTHVQSGPTCTQLLAWFGADVIKVERPGVGDITRGQLQDVKGADSLYFTMLNHNKRSITLDTKNPKGKEVLTALIRSCDVLVENFGPGVLDRMGFTWDKIQEINPRMIVASIKGFGPGPYEDCKVYENVAQCTGGAASTTGFRTASRPATASPGSSSPTSRSSTRSGSWWPASPSARSSSLRSGRPAKCSKSTRITASARACRFRSKSLSFLNPS